MKLGVSNIERFLMKIFATAFLALVTASTVLAGPACNVSKEKWMKETDFRQLMEKQGYQIKTFKVSSGQCYEIYGLDKDGRKVEIYFDPATAAVVDRK